jgi:hypothetical protein
MRVAAGEKKRRAGGRLGGATRRDRVEGEKECGKIIVVQF